MRKLIICLLASAILLTPLTSLAEDTCALSGCGGPEFDFAPAGISPDSFWYPFDRLKEEIVLFFTFSPVVRAQKLLRFSTERLSEAEKMWQEDKEKEAEKALRVFGRQLRRFKKLALAVKKKRVPQWEEVRKDWQEILAQELVFLLERKAHRTEEMVQLVREVKKSF